MESKIKIDKKDKEILFHLDTDARAPLSGIAKKLGLSKQVVKYRIDRLIRDGVIQKSLLFVNGTKLGYVAYKFYIKLQNVDEVRLNKIVGDFVKSEAVVWVATCEGKYDLAIAPIARNNVEAYAFLNDLLLKYKDYVRDVTTLNYIDVSHLKKVHLVDKNRTIIESPFWGDEPEHYKLDKYEFGILSILCENARKSIVDIAEEIGTSVDIIQNRIKKLIRDKIIVGSTIILNKYLLGYEYHKILLKIRFYNKGEEKTFLDFVKSEKNIVDVVRMMGEWNYELDLEVRNIYDVHEIMMRVRNKFVKNIQGYDSLMILEEHKLNFFPMKSIYHS